jgi:hypothetical protein
MKNKKEWETKSLEWIHKVRERIDEEITRQGVSPAKWIRDRGKIDIRSGLRGQAATFNKLVFKY